MNLFSDMESQPPDLSLKDYRNIYSRFCFLDESGSLNDSQSPFFTVGLIKCTQPYYLYDKIIYERGKRHFYDEMKFNKLSKNNIDFVKLVLDLFFGTQSLNFVTYTLDKEGPYFNREFGGDPWAAYEDISVRLMKAALYHNEILILIADYVTTPKNIKFEVNVKRRINEEQSRLAVAGVCRIDSRANDLLQLVDLIIGAINYSLKLETGVITKGDKYKRRFTEYFLEKIGSPTISAGFKNNVFNIFVDKDIMRRF